MNIDGLTEDEFNFLSWALQSLRRDRDQAVGGVKRLVTIGDMLNMLRRLAADQERQCGQYTRMCDVADTTANFILAMSMKRDDMQSALGAYSQRRRAAQ